VKVCHGGFLPGARVSQRSVIGGGPGRMCQKSVATTTFVSHATAAVRFRPPACGASVQTGVRALVLDCLSGNKKNLECFCRADIYGVAVAVAPQWGCSVCTAITPLLILFVRWSDFPPLFLPSPVNDIASIQRRDEMRVVVAFDLYD
jgi:hypothetical protein